MFEQFITWDMLAVYGTLVASTYMIVEFTKELPFISLLKTKYYSAIVAFALILVTNLHANTFTYWDIVLYTLSAIAISLSSNGLSDFNNPVDKTQKE